MIRRAAPWLWSPALLLLQIACAPAPGQLEVVILDERGSSPARLEVIDVVGDAHVADDALPVPKECAVAPVPGWAARAQDTIWGGPQSLYNRHRGATQFYSDGASTLTLAPGRYTLSAFKGIEYSVSRREIVIVPNETKRLELTLERWSDLPARGWFAADDHLHITRSGPEDDAVIGEWMRAEDLNVANLLQMGTMRQFGVTPQYEFGPDGVHRTGDTIVMAGQEHPRTHFLGHTITLGAREPIDLRETYIVYRNFWEESRRLGGVSGFAHFGRGPARDGLAIDAPTGLLTFMEVLQFDAADYRVWYELLNLGLRFTPTAGTDFPCGPWSIPGRERFYTRIEGALQPESWLEGIRRGRTFVTNGPLLEFSVGSARIGDDLRLDGPGEVRVRAVVRFDPSRDDVAELQVVRNGEKVLAESVRSAEGEIRIDATVAVPASSWFALRAVGEKVDETLMPDPPPEWVMDIVANVASGADVPQQAGVRPSAAHTAPIWVEAAGTAPIARQPRAGELARESLERLDALEARLADANIEEIPIWDLFYSDGVTLEHLRRNRDALRAAIAAARASYQPLAAN